MEIERYEIMKLEVQSLKVVCVFVVLGLLLKKIESCLEFLVCC